jgi:DNA-binding NarL/FixJ family response regulator
MEITIGIADDHQLFVRSLSILINAFTDIKVIAEALNGNELLNKLEIAQTRPDIILLDVQMPIINGIQVAEKIAQLYPEIKIAALSSKDDDATVISMIRAGCCAYLLKDMHPAELEKALYEIYDKGYYNADASNINYRRLIKKAYEDDALSITEREKTFLKFACSDLTYKQIAAKMYLSERTIDGYRESLFEKLNVRSRVGMALEGIRRNIVSIK